MHKPTLKNLEEYFGDYARHEGISPSKLAKEIKAAIVSSEPLLTINTLIGGFSIESIIGRDINSEWDNVVALYINTGDLYTATIVYETETGKYWVTTLGDWREKNDKKYSVI